MNKYKSSMENSHEFEISKLVAGYLTNSLTPLEKERFDGLLKSDKHLQTLLSRYHDSGDTQKRIDYLDGLDIESSLQKVYSKRVKRSNPLNTYLSYAAVFIAFILIAAWFFQSKDDPRVVKDTVYGYKNDVLPGEEKAQLILSDGTVVELGFQSNELTEIDGAYLKESNGELSYSNTTGDFDSEVYNTLIVPEAGTFRLVLPDGTRVWLNANSKIEYPTRFIGVSRNVKLTGEAYFEVAHNPERPFRVEVNQSIITALGTSFNINSYDENNLTTTLISGKVSAESGQKQVLLEPGKRLIINKEEMTVKVANVEKELAWKNGYFSFDGESFYQAIEQIGRWYGVAVSFRGDIKNEQIGGSISRTANLSEVLEMLKEVSNLTFEINGKELLVIKN